LRSISGKEQHSRFAFMGRKIFFMIRLANLLKARGSSSPIPQEGILVATPEIVSLGKRLRASGAEHFHHAGVRQGRG
jgi:hypothetical protein